jgi:hypothetical protein
MTARAINDFMFFSPNIKTKPKLSDEKQEKRLPVL